MRSGKRVLAGAAAGALALGVLSIAGASGASAGKAKPQYTPGTSSASIGPVRYTETASTQDPVYTANLVFQGSSSDDSTISPDDTIVFNLASAPSAAAAVWLSNETIIVPTNAKASADDTLYSVANPSTDDTFLNSAGAHWFNYTDDSVFDTYIGVGAAGIYNGTIKIYDGASPSGSPAMQTVTWSITTAGAPKTMTLNPTSLSLTASTNAAAAGEFTVSFEDASGNLTQLGASNGDKATFASASTSIVSAPTADVVSAASMDDSAAATLGTTTVTVQPTATAGSTTVDGTVAGTLPSAGVAGGSVSVTTAAGGSTSPTALSLTAPTTNVVDDSPASSGDDTLNYTLNTILSSATIVGTGATPNAVQTVYVGSSSGWAGLSVAGSSVGASASKQVLVTADGDGTVTIPVAWTTAGTKLVVRTGTSDPHWVQIYNSASAWAGESSPSGSIVQKVGEATSFDVTIQDQYGNAAVGYLVTGKAGSGSSSSVGVTDSSGKTTISVPAPSSTYSGSANVVFTVLNSGGGAASSGMTPSNVAVTYTSTGEITSMSVSVNGGANATTLTSPTAATVTAIAASVVPPVTGVISSVDSTDYYTLATSTTPGSLTGNAIHQLSTFVISPTPANASTVTVPEGLYVSAKKPSKIEGSQTATIANGGTAYVWGTKTGTFDVTIESGGQTITGQVVIYNTNMDAYNIALSPSSQNLGTGAIGTVALTVTDAWGNGVEAASADDTGGVKISASGSVLLAGFATSNTYATDENGNATVTIVAGNSPGTGTLTATPAGGTSTKTPAWKSTFTKPTGWTAPVTSSSATVLVSESAVKSIVITGERGTVKGKPGVMVDGLTTGFAEGASMVPYIKFPGQTSYSEGSARPKVDSAGEFYWQRKTGKKIYIYFANEDGTVKSERIIIQAK